MVCVAGAGGLASCRLLLLSGAAAPYAADAARALVMVVGRRLVSRPAQRPPAGAARRFACEFTARRFASPPLFPFPGAAVSSVRGGASSCV